MKVSILSLFVFTICMSTPVLSHLNLFKQNIFLANQTAAFKNVDLDKLPAYYPLLYALQYIFIGKPNPDLPSIFDIVDSADDNITLFEIIVLLSQNFNLYWTENEFDEEGFDELWKDWLQILTVFGVEGPNGVDLGMLKPYIKLLKPENLLEVWKKVNKVEKNLNQYIREEILEKIKNPYCKNYVGLWFQDIQKGKLWAISMFDNIAKPPTGLLNGNINWVGSYKACKKIEVDVGNGNGFHGKYCRTTLGFPLDALPDVGIPINDNIGINIGWCVPHQCEREDVIAISQKTIELFALHKLLKVSNVKCDDDVPYSTEFIAFTIILSMIVCFVIAATVFDGVYRSIKPEEPVENSESIEIKGKLTGGLNKNTKQSKPSKNPIIDFLLNCSMYSNAERIFRTDNGGKFTCLNGLRALSMVWIVCAHVFNYLGDYKLFFLLSNIKEMKDIEELPIAQLIISGMYGVDTFFVMSAFLLTYSMLNKLEKHNRLTAFEWAYYYIHRYWRLLPPYLITMVIYIWIMPYVGNGPLWNVDSFPSNNYDCKHYWWVYILFLNNFIPNGKGTTCMGYLWYVPNDYQLYAISPIFLIILFKFPIAGMVLLVFTLIASVSILAFLTENIYASQGKVILTTLQSIWEDVYIKPYCRAGPWIVGIFLGYIFFKYKKITMNKIVTYVLVSFGWITSTVLALSAVFGSYKNHDPDVTGMTIPEYGAYFSITRVTFPLSIAWIIFACHYGYGGIINRFLSARAFIPLTRISYCAYLIHPVIINAYFYTQEALFHGSGLTLIYLMIGNLIFTFFVSFLFTMFFELPFIAIEKLLMSGRNKNSGGE